MFFWAEALSVKKCRSFIDFLSKSPQKLWKSLWKSGALHEKTSLSLYFKRVCTVSWPWGVC